MIKNKNSKRSNLKTGLLQFESWESFNDSGIYKGYKSGFPKTISWYSFLGIIEPSNVQATLDHISKYISEYGEQISKSENVKKQLETSQQKLSKNKITSAADFLCLTDKNLKSKFQTVYLCNWEHFANLYHNAHYLFNGGPEQLRTAYIFASCSMKNLDTNNIDRNFKKLCPNPCLFQPCMSKRNTYTDECEQVDNDFQIYNDNYKCKCNDQYEWDQKTLECRPMNLCYLNEYCGGLLKSHDCKMIRRQAELVALGFKDYEVLCSCTRPYMGARCDQQRNPCIDNFYTELPFGNKACGDHGKCIPTNGTNEYKCECDNGWNDDPHKSYPDCSHSIDPCLAIKCINGFCKLSNDRIHAECICNEGFSGQYCEIITGQWLQWMQWSSCKPGCGFDRKRHRKRICSDLKNMGTCYQLGSLADIQFMKCDTRPCINLGTYSKWSKWSSCHSGCKKYRNRMRECIYKSDPYGELLKVNCLGPRIEYKECPILFNCDFLLHRIAIVVIVSLVVYGSILYFFKKRIRKMEKFMKRLIEKLIRVPPVRDVEKSIEAKKVDKRKIEYKRNGNKK
jgi:hypothetical protein